MSHEQPRYGDRDPRTSEWPGTGGQRRQGNSVPTPGGASSQPDPTLIIPATNGGRSGGGRAGGPGRKPPKPPARVPRWLLTSLVVVLVLAVLAIVGLVLRGGPTQSVAVGHTSTPPTSPSSAATSPSSSTATSPAASPAGSPTGSDASPTATSDSIAAGGGGSGAPVANVSALTTLNSTDIGNLSNGPEQIGAVTYQNSVGFTCYTSGNDANFVYDVAGYKFLNTVLGVPSDSTNATGNAMTITFFKDGATQLGQPVTISLDHPQSVHLNLQGASQLEIACNATNVTSHQQVDMDAALGNATIGPS